MKLKNSLTFGKWVAYIELPEGGELRVPEVGFAKTRAALVPLVLLSIDHLAVSGNPEYRVAIAKEAASLGMGVEEFVGLLVEHQLCVRSGGTQGGLCYNGGVGDAFHSLVERVDGVVERRAPKMVQGAIKAVVKKILPTSENAHKEGYRKVVSGCTSCGGRRSISREGNNAGRVTKANNLFRKK